eukprot:SAG31_NODE_5426_length_2545_cov_2.943581_3_plen_84_part_00
MHAVVKRIVGIPKNWHQTVVFFAATSACTYLCLCRSFRLFESTLCAGLATLGFELLLCRRDTRAAVVDRVVMAPSTSPMVESG